MRRLLTLIASRYVYGTIRPNLCNIKYINNYNSLVVNADRRFILNEIRKDFSDMQFDVIMSNPPYNKGMDLDFVNLGFDLAKQYAVFITPAKWQTAEGDQKVVSKTLNYSQFRKKIVPHMKEVVYYPDCIELFGISENSGITYYIVTKEVHDEKDIINKAYYQPLVNSEIKRTLNEDDTLWNIGSQILNKINSKNEDKFKLNIIDEYNRKEYTICASKQWCGSRVSSGAWDMQASSIKPSAIGKGGCIFNPAGNIKVIGKIVGLRKGEHDNSGSSVYIFTSDSKDECNSFYSWITTKLVSFLILINLKGSIIMNDTTLKYIPDPGQFDHIFTNDEMYARYKLTDDEINIIESVIK